MGTWMVFFLEVDVKGSGLFHLNTRATGSSSAGPYMVVSATSAYKNYRFVSEKQSKTRRTESKISRDRTLMSSHISSFSISRAC